MQGVDNQWADGFIGRCVHAILSGFGRIVNVKERGRELYGSIAGRSARTHENAAHKVCQVGTIDVGDAILNVIHNTENEHAGLRDVSVLLNFLGSYYRSPIYPCAHLIAAASLNGSAEFWELEPGVTNRF